MNTGHIKIININGELYVNFEDVINFINAGSQDKRIDHYSSELIKVVARMLEQALGKYARSTPDIDPGQERVRKGA